MIAPSKLDIWFAEAVIRVYEPWLTSTCVGITDGQRREIADLVTRARRIAGEPALPSLWPPGPPPQIRRFSGRRPGGASDSPAAVPSAPEMPYGKPGGDLRP